MTDRRRKNIEWNVGSDPLTWEKVNAALLMDIRDELQQLNRLLSCPNFIQIPRVLRGIRQNTAKPSKKLAAKPAGTTGK